MEILTSLSIILIGGLIASRIVRVLKLPSVTAYILFGILIGPFALNLTSDKLLLSSGIISNFVLGIVAFSLGEGLSIKFIKKLGKVVVWIPILEAVGAWILVTLVFLIVLKQPLYLSLIFGSIASATAPAATMAIVRELKAKGTFTDVLLGVVAIDDAWCLIIFALSLAISKALYFNGEDIYLFNIIGKGLYEIGGAFVVGGITGLACIGFSKFLLKRDDDLLVYTIGFILISMSLSIYLHLSLLLTCMAMGTVVNNIGDSGRKLFESIRRIDSFLYLIFFVIVGASLEINLMSSVGILVIVYMLARVVGKIGGAFLGAYISEAPQSIKYLGLALVPQAGVALGVAMIAKTEFPVVGGFILTTIIAEVIMNELIGPPCTRFAIVRSGDSQVK
ncbi:MAG: cation:proton antiporter [Thermodesulfobacteriota bacterium]